ncbi:hypothetical protein H6F90_19790 [Trichocoleus sp. FACHB-591]|uniref:hypothetical protein n=1 Tax=Trichocoleus sp. FACHB-591 TaxID=2692872 RepID=UPI0016831B08|nr:hypothetical protein [Trichocoleus sp. FACHB-591]MBD2097345.1 hypothetical protein [Trichocoleus sp. FACHB-591]
MFFSQEYRISKIVEHDWFDARLDDDTKLFIDPFLIFETDVPHFRNTRNKFVDFFKVAFDLAIKTKGSELHPAYKKLKNMLTFPEVPELCLGYSQGSTSGSGTGGGFATILAGGILDAISLGRMSLNHFEELEIFTTGIGKDRVSDVTANILKQEFIQYTKQICDELNIPTRNFHIKNIHFDERNLRWNSAYYRLPQNPYRLKQAVILVPSSFLRLSPAISSTGFMDYIWEYKDEEIRNDLNYLIYEEIKEKIKKKDLEEGEEFVEEETKKRNLKTKSISVQIAKKHPEWIDEFIDHIENEVEILPYDLEQDKSRLYQPHKTTAEKVAEKTTNFIYSNPLQLTAIDSRTFLDSINMMIEQYRVFIEENAGWELLWNEKRSLQTKKKSEEEYEESKKIQSSDNQHLNKDSNAALDIQPDTASQVSFSDSLNELDEQKEDLDDSNNRNNGKKKEERVPKKENAAQITFVSVVRSYCQANNIDLTREANIGRGPVDFKFSSGYSDRALLEVKLASNPKLLKGLESQLTTYLRAEQIKYGYYLIIFHYKEDLKKIEEVRESIDVIAERYAVDLKLIAIDASLEKPSASTL